MRNERIEIEKKTYCQPRIRIQEISQVLLSATSNTLPVTSGETVTEEEQLSKQAPGW
ncbi:MAG: hypothetical protein ACOYJK_10640 [Prevotella sp.]|jgi:hypothetical protein